MNIGEQIKKYREELKISQEELADRIFVTRQTISNWENDKNYPDIKSLSLLCNVFDVSLDQFVKGDIEEMKKIIDNGEIEKFNFMSIIFTIEFIVMIVSAYPLLKFCGIIGLIIWTIITFVTLITCVVIENMKKNHDIQTYKEIVAFTEGRTLDKKEIIEENAKRPYQKILLSIGSAIIAMITFAILELIFG